MITTLEILKAARACVARGLCQHANARDLFGNPCWPTDDDARRWDLTGSIIAQSGVTNYERLVEAMRAVADVAFPWRSGNDDFKGLFDMLTTWNDASDRRGSDVVAVLDKAIETLSQKAAA